MGELALKALGARGLRGRVLELATMAAGDTSQTGLESAPVVVRDPERFQTWVTVFMTAIVVLLVSVLAVAMNLT
jgi:hypothetical protein